jgi:hypothetical protein
MQAKNVGCKPAFFCLPISRVRVDAANRWAI